MKASGTRDACRVSGLFADMEGARRAIDALQNDGIEAGRISLSGEGADSAARMANSQRNSSASDAPILWRVVWRCVFWSIVGGVLGAVVGFALGSSRFGAFPGMSNSLPIQVASWAMFLHVAGALWGAYAGVSSGSAWELTFQPVESGRVSVDVSTANERDSSRAERVMRSRSALSVQRPDRAVPDAAVSRYP